MMIALALAAVGSCLLVLYLRRFEYTVSGGQKIEVLTLVKPLERGERIREEVLATRLVPIAYLEDRAVKGVERSRVIGLPTTNALTPQQTLQWTDLAVTTENRDLSSLVQQGKRGVAVQAAAIGSALVRPGDYVDVLFIDSSGADATSSVLLQRVLVLAVGSDTRGGLGSEAPDTALGNRDRTLTLSLNLTESQIIALAVAKGQLSVAVRNVHDPSVQDDVVKIRPEDFQRAHSPARTQQPGKPRTQHGPTPIVGERR